MASAGSSDKTVPYVVAIGASAGGLEALEEFFSNLPTGTGMAFVVLQHLTPDFKSLMDELLARRTKTPISKVEQDMPIEPDMIYLLPSNSIMTVNGGRFALTERDPAMGLNLPIDHFFVSLASEWKEHAIGVVLSGTGSDGARGIRAIHEAGGLVICQSPETARFDGMPRSAEATGVVDLSIAPAAMPAMIVDYIKHDRTIARGALDSRSDAADGDPFAPIYEILSERYSVDFHDYKIGTISRRIERRMALHGVATIDGYASLLNTLPNEPLNLFRDLLIGVTEFFRDPTAWQIVEETLIPQICAQVSNNREIRCWVPGCATGEEAYSLAILLHEYLTQHSLPVNVRIFATDVHTDSLETAGSGIYPASALGSMPPARVARYFKRIDDERYQVTPEVRALVVFAKQNLIADPPFTKLDLVSCRNAIIYFEPEVQQTILAVFHFSLNVGGFMFLGPSESLGEVQSEFDTLERHWKIFSKRRNARLPNAYRARARKDIKPVVSATGTWAQSSGNRQVAGRDISLLQTYDVLLERHVPPSILIDGNGRLAHTFNRASDYLRAPHGIASLDVFDVIHPELRTALSTGMQRAQKEPGPIRYGGIRVHVADGDERIVRVSIEALNESSPTDYFIVTFEEAHRIENGPENPVATLPSPPPASGEVLEFDVSSANYEHVARLEQELRYTKEYLQATVEELETSNEELQATNEELMAANEELQSTNEELHSVNEELYTVNREYEAKIVELTELTDDMDNLLESTEIGTVFLDDALCIRRFTPAVGKQFSLLNQDIGRPIGHLHRKINYPDFLDDLALVLRTGQEVEQEVRDPDGNWFLMRMHPYRRESGDIDGVVVTFVDVTGIKLASEQLAQRNEDLQGFAYAISHDMNEPLRMIVGFSGLFTERNRGQFDAKSDGYLAQIDDGASRLQAMLRGVLDYSRVVTRANPRETVEFTEILSEACAQLQDEIEQHEVVISTDTLPPALRVDRRQIVRVIAELLHNAIKFSDVEQPKIRFDAERREHEWRIAILDNGPGIPPDRVERVFEIFQRLPEAKDVSGHGVGLAVARRIAEQHGGDLCCEVRPERGARFVLSLPVIEGSGGSER